MLTTELVDVEKGNIEYQAASTEEENVSRSSDVVWTDVNFTVGSKNILHNCWGSVCSILTKHDCVFSLFTQQIKGKRHESLCDTWVQWMWEKLVAECLVW